MEQEKRIEKLNELDIDVALRLSLVQLCGSVSLNDLPAIYDFVKDGDLGKIYARQRAKLMQWADVMRTPTGSPKELQFFQELVNLVQHSFSDDPRYGDLYERLKLSSLRDEDVRVF